MSIILSTAAVVPTHRYGQAEIKDVYRHTLPGLMGLNGHEKVFERSGVKTRYLVEPADFYLSKPSFEARNKAYFEHALSLASRCLTSCLGEAGVDFARVNHIVSVTTTGLLTPSLEAHLAQALPFPRTVKRTPVFGTGCAGGVAGLSRGEDYLKGHPDQVLVVLSVELCSLTFLPGEDSMVQLIAASLFGDGAAAVLLAGEASGIKGGCGAQVVVVDSESVLLPDSLDVMGWEFKDEGMKLVLSRRAPAVIEAHVRGAVDGFLARHGLTVGDIDRFLLHPGSLKIIEAFERALNLGPGQTRFTRDFLENYGNLSSASVLFILRAALAERPPAGGYGLLATMGPGFACEMLLLRFAP